MTTRAVSRATRDGQRASRFAFAVRVTDGSALVASNRAHARASCRNCRALAVSVQIVVAGHVKDVAIAPAPGKPPSARISNLVVAEDLARGVRSRSTTGVAGCSRCATTALAYQFVIVGRHRLQITPAARARLAAIQTRMRQATASGGSPATVRKRLDALAGEIDSVLRTGVVLAPH